ncbi:MAG: hypothetical protein FJX75_11590 [Armatimonadetes bacterium]|nr:hypothetical protein [Armatimonadota bacterium]
MPAMSAAQEVLLAAARLSGPARREFTEWDLTVQVWQLNSNRFGCRGYEGQYPDHKRVMMELMGRRKPVTVNGWIEKTRTNWYRITPLGLAEADRLSGGTRNTHRRQIALYDALQPFALHRVFEAHLGDHAEPRTWLGAAAFLSLAKDDADALGSRMRHIRAAAREAEVWMDETGQPSLRRGDARRPITRERVRELAAFLTTLEERFARQFEAIAAKQA